MFKRTLAAFLWFFAGWYLGAFVAFASGVSPVIGPLLGMAAAALVAGDPLGMFWSRKTTEAMPDKAGPHLEKAVS